MYNFFCFCLKSVFINFLDLDEISRLNDRLREKGVDIETERKLEQVCEHVKDDIFLSVTQAYSD